MRITTIEMRETLVTKDIRCNNCGESCGVVMDGEGSRLDFCGLIEARVSGGYYSPILPDTSTFRFSLCEPCLARLFSTFAIKPAADDDMGYDKTNEHEWVDGRCVTK